MIFPVQEAKLPALQESLEFTSGYFQAYESVGFCSTMGVPTLLVPSGMMATLMAGA